MSMSFRKASKEHSKQLYIDPKDRPSEGHVLRSSCDDCLGKTENDEDKVEAFAFKLTETLFMATIL